MPAAVRRAAAGFRLLHLHRRILDGLRLQGSGRGAAARRCTAAEVDAARRPGRGGRRRGSRSGDAATAYRSSASCASGRHWRRRCGRALRLASQLVHAAAPHRAAAPHPMNEGSDERQTKEQPRQGERPRRERCGRPRARADAGEIRRDAERALRHEGDADRRRRGREQPPRRREPLKRSGGTRSHTSPSPSVDRLRRVPSALGRAVGR